MGAFTALTRGARTGCGCEIYGPGTRARGRILVIPRRAPPRRANGHSSSEGRIRNARTSEKRVGSTRTAFSSEPMMAKSSNADSSRSGWSISESSRVRSANSNKLRPRSVGLSPASSIWPSGATASTGVVAGVAAGWPSTAGTATLRIGTGASTAGFSHSSGTGMWTRCSNTMKVPSWSPWIAATFMTEGCSTDARRRAPARNRSLRTGSGSRQNSRLTTWVVDSSSARQTSVLSSPRW